MRKHFNRAWQLIYPLLLYAIIYQVSDGIFRIMLPENRGDILPLFLAAIVTLPFLIFLYRRVPIVKAEKLFDKKDLKRDLFLIIICIGVGIILNILVSKLAVFIDSSGFEQANMLLGSGNLIIRFLTTCIVVPVLEEILYRGIIAGQSEVMYGFVPAIIISALAFGIMHANIIQGLYAFLVGLVFSYTYLKTRRIWTVILAHSALNIIVLVTSLV